MLADIVGIDPKILDYGVATIVALVCLSLSWWGGKIMFFLVTTRQEETKETIAQDEKQTYLEQTLANLASSALSESKLTREAYEKNNGVLERNTIALDKNAEAMSAIVKTVSILLDSVNSVTLALKDHDAEVEHIKDIFSDKFDVLIGQVTQMNQQAPVKIVVKDEKGEVITELLAIEKKTEEGVTEVVVTVTEPKEETKQEETPAKEEQT